MYFEDIFFRPDKPIQSPLIPEFQPDAIANITHDVSAWLHSMRKERGLTQTQLSQKTKISRVRLSVLENGNGYMLLHEYIRLCQTFGLSEGVWHVA